MKIGLLGYKGFVGSNVFKKLKQTGNYEIICIDRDKIIEQNLDILINCAGSVKKFYAELNPISDIESNYKLLNKIFSLKFEKIIHISSIDAHNPFTLYGKNKLWVESVIQHCFKKCSIIRLAGLVGEGLSKNVIFDLLNNNKVWVTKDSEYNYINIDLLGDVIIKHIELGNGDNILFNFASSKNITVGELEEIFNKKICYGEKIEKYDYIPIDYLKSLISVQTSEYYIKNIINNL